MTVVLQFPHGIGPAIKVSSINGEYIPITIQEKLERSKSLFRCGCSRRCSEVICTDAPLAVCSRNSISIFNL